MALSVPSILLGVLSDKTSSFSLLIGVYNKPYKDKERKYSENIFIGIFKILILHNFLFLEFES